MEIEYGDSRRLSHGVIKYLNNYKVNENKRTLYVNFILQVYQCVPLLNTNYYSCSLFDDESICKSFIIKYNSNEGRPYEGDIISITKIIINILNEKDSRIYCCEETKLLEKSAKFLIEPNSLINITSKKKVSKNEENMNKNKSNKKMNKDIEDKKEEKVKVINNKEIKKEIKDEKKIDKNYIDLENEETDITNNNICDKNEDNKDKNNIKEINEEINDNNIINNNKLNGDKIKVNLIKIEPKKLDENPKVKETDIIESINLFIDDFEDGKNISKEENNCDTSINFGNINKIKDNKEEKESNDNKKYNSKDYKNNIIRRIQKNKQIKNNDNIIKIIYIYELKEILKIYKNRFIDFKVKIKCRIKAFFPSYNNFYIGCSNCHRKIRNNMTCCKNKKEELLFFFCASVRDASGEVTVFFFDKSGRKLMNMSAQEYKELYDNKDLLGKKFFSNFINNLYDYEYLFTIEFWEPKTLDEPKKRYKVIEVEKIDKKHKYEMVKELKNILKVND